MAQLDMTQKIESFSKEVFSDKFLKNDYFDRPDGDMHSNSSGHGSTLE